MPATQTRSSRYITHTKPSTPGLNVPEVIILSSNGENAQPSKIGSSRSKKNTIKKSKFPMHEVLEISSSDEEPLLPKAPRNDGSSWQRENSKLKQSPGADVIHPTPGSDGRPSFTALVGNVDSDTAKYIATSRVQTSRVEIIEDLQDMAKHVLSMYMKYRQFAEKKTGNLAPARLIFYRDGVSEGQFKQVLDNELKSIKEACAELKINPKITIIAVAKRHHVRFFPSGSNNQRGLFRSRLL
ncbi:hypothetical protein P692DRAFT_201246313 [Suillus brevipes Sb2]|nr:hypothetical protein P692DRAFT_201246313 [Suillus brevipes Sb2]